MTRLLQIPANAAALVIRALAFSLLLAAPVLAVPSISTGQGVVIEAPAAQKTGLGFVLLVSLQRLGRASAWRQLYLRYHGRATPKRAFESL